MAEPVKVAILGAAGRMGRMLLRLASETPGVVLAGGADRQGSSDLDRDLGELAGIGGLGLRLTDDVPALLAASEVAIDFTRPEASLANARLCAAAGVAQVVGTTGLDEAQKTELEAVSQQVPILFAPNMSQGVTLLLSLVETVARALDEGYDIEVVEMHHRMKVDAPSGTALGLGEAAARGRGRPLPELWVKSRDGHTGAREAGTIGFATLRGGDVIGEHSVIFAGIGERIEISHKATSREVFASGALRAAKWLQGRPPGLYSMRDVLGL